MKKIRKIFHSMRPYQWIKNLAVFAAIIFNEKLFDNTLFYKSFLAFVVYCFVSSSSYLINDVVDAPLDRLHPQKKDRPIAKGEVSRKEALLTAGLLLVVGLLISFSLGKTFLLLIISFYVIHLIYSFVLKKMPIVDIFGISISFILRTLAGEIVTGYHLPVWLMFTVVFLSLFVASGKRRGELIKEGSKTRPSLKKYSKALLNFYVSIFAVLTLISYALFTYLFEFSLDMETKISQFLWQASPGLVDRKWLMLTIFPVILGTMRYSQLVLERKRGQRPEKILASDIPLLINILAWGAMVILFIYGF